MAKTENLKSGVTLLLFLSSSSISGSNSNSSIAATWDKGVERSSEKNYILP